MSKGLLIAEKNSLAEAIQKVYYKIQNELPYRLDFAVQSGHLVQLIEPEEYDPALEKWNWETLPIFPKQYGGWQYKVILNTREKYKVIAKKMKENHYDFIVHAGDPDREGEYLVHLVLEKLENRLPVKRFWTNDITFESVAKELRNLHNDSDQKFQNLLKSAYCRAHFDWLFGMNITRAATLAMHGTARCGRVKTPVLKIVVDREMEIRNFKPTTSYLLESRYTEGFSGLLFDQDGDVFFKTKADAEKFAKENLDGTAVVKEIRKEKQTAFAPSLYNLSALQVEASRKYGYDPDDTLNTVQSLYEKEFLTYPRTSCVYLSSEMVAYFKSMLRSAGSVPNLQFYSETITNEDIDKVRNTKKYINDKEIENEGHTALVPTGVSPEWEKLSPKEKNIYELVAKRFIAIFLPPLISEKTTVITENNGYLFKTNGKIMIQKGYTELYDMKVNDIHLPNINKGDIVHVQTNSPVERTTTCPKRYTAGDLIDLMVSPSKFLIDQGYKDIIKEIKGIGTEATRATIIKELIKNKYIEEKKGKGKALLIYATDTGIKIIQNIGKRDIVSVDLTAEWETKLKSIEMGEMDTREFENSAEQYIIKNVAAFQNANMDSLKKNINSVGICPKCGKPLYSSQKSWYCSGYKEGCDFAIWKVISGKHLTDFQMNSLLEKGYTPEIKGFKSKTGKEFSAYLVLDENKKVAFSFTSPKPNKFELKCPKCGGDIIKNSRGYGCSNYKEKGCNFFVWETIAGKKITESMLNTLLNKGKTGLIKGFTSKNGKKFDARLVYKDGKVGFEF